MLLGWGTPLAGWGTPWTWNGVPPSWMGYPLHLDLGWGIPQSAVWGTPHLDLGWGSPLSAGWGTPIWTGDRVPPLAGWGTPLDLGWGTPLPGPGMGYSPGWMGYLLPGPGMGYPPGWMGVPLAWTWDGVTPPRNVDRQTPAKTVPSLVLRTRAVMKVKTVMKWPFTADSKRE